MNITIRHHTPPGLNRQVETVPSLVLGLFPSRTPARCCLGLWPASRVALSGCTCGVAGKYRVACRVQAKLFRLRAFFGGSGTLGHRERGNPGLWKSSLTGKVAVGVWARGDVGWRGGGSSGQRPRTQTAESGEGNQPGVRRFRRLPMRCAAAGDGHARAPARQNEIESTAPSAVLDAGGGRAGWSGPGSPHGSGCRTHLSRVMCRGSVKRSPSGFRGVSEGRHPG
jgi:hypothetical protein